MDKIFLVIPCYNEESRLDELAFREVLATKENLFIIFVNDGSSDNTIAILKRIKELAVDRVNIIDNQENLGKAESVRLGINQAVTDGATIVGYLDADLATSLDEALRLIEFLKVSEKQLVFGVRIRTLNNLIIRKRSRHVFGRVFATLAARMLRLTIYDTQCGAKFFKRELAEKLFREEFLSRWLFDVEIFARIIGLKLVVSEIAEEMCLKQWVDKGESRVSFFAIIAMPLEMLKIAKKYNLKIF